MKREESKKNFDLESQFLVGFCGPNLGDAERLQLLSGWEEKFRQLDRSTVTPGSVLDLLSQWADGKVHGRDMAHQIFQYWMEEMGHAADRISRQRKSWLGRFREDCMMLRMLWSVAPADCRGALLSEFIFNQKALHRRFEEEYKFQNFLRKAFANG